MGRTQDIRGKKKGRRGMIRGKKTAKGKNLPLPIDLKLLKTSQLVKLRHLLQNWTKGKLLVSVTEREERDEDRKDR